MHMIKKWCGSPCDRRKDRRKVAIAACAALLLFATTAQAGVVNLNLDSSVSSLSYAGSTVDLHNFGGPVNTPYTAQTDLSGGGANGLLSYFSGNMYMDNGASAGSPYIQPLATGAGYQNALGSAVVPMGPKLDGGYIPYDDGYGHPSGSFPNPVFGGAPADWGEYGIKVSAVGAFARVWDLSIGPTPTFANGAMPQVAPNTYAVAPQIWGLLGGYQDLVSGLGNAHTSLANALGSGVAFPMVLSGTLDLTSGSPVYTPGSGVATWDGTTLTIAVNGKVIYNIQGSQGSADQIADSRVLSGVLVYHLAPEPSSMAIMCLGIVGLASYGWRARKRRA